MGWQSIETSVSIVRFIVSTLFDPANIRSNQTAIVIQRTLGGIIISLYLPVAGAYESPELQGNAYYIHKHDYLKSMPLFVSFKSILHHDEFARNSLSKQPRAARGARGGAGLLPNFIGHQYKVHSTENTSLWRFFMVSNRWPYRVRAISFRQPLSYAKSKE